MIPRIIWMNINSSFQLHVHSFGAHFTAWICIFCCIFIIIFQFYVLFLNTSSTRSVQQIVSLLFHDFWFPSLPVGTQSTLIKCKKSDDWIHKWMNEYIDTPRYKHTHRQTGLHDLKPEYHYTEDRIKVPLVSCRADDTKPFLYTIETTRILWQPSIFPSYNMIL